MTFLSFSFKMARGSLQGFSIKSGESGHKNYCHPPAVHKEFRQIQNCLCSFSFANKFHKPTDFTRTIIVLQDLKRDITDQHAVVNNYKVPLRWPACILSICCTSAFPSFSTSFRNNEILTDTAKTIEN